MKKHYRNFSLSLIFTALFSLTGSAQNAWINEFHYDNIGQDAGEFIEVVIENAGSYNLAGFSVVLYNGSPSSGSSYNTTALDLYTTGAVIGNFTLFYYNYTDNSLAIQNGNQGGTEPDGMALTYQDVVIPGQFLSYEGTFTAVGGPADGMLSVDIGVMEDNPVPEEGVSLQLSGTGSIYSVFSWQPPATATKGQLNNDQELMLVGFDELKESGIRVCPDPNNGIFRLFNPYNEEFPVSIYNVNGQLVSEVMIGPGNNSISLTGASGGIYVLRYDSRDGKIRGTERMIIY